VAKGEYTERRRGEVYDTTKRGLKWKFEMREEVFSLSNKKMYAHLYASG
jgi:hypothetical protein